MKIFYMLLIILFLLPVKVHAEPNISDAESLSR